MHNYTQSLHFTQGTPYEGVKSAEYDRYFSTVFKMQIRTINYKNRHPWMTDALRAQIKFKKCYAFPCNCTQQ